MTRDEFSARLAAVCDTHIAEVTASRQSFMDAYQPLIDAVDLSVGSDCLKIFMMELRRVEKALSGYPAQG